MLAHRLTPEWLLSSEECSMLCVTLLTLFNFQLLYHLERKKNKKKTKMIWGLTDSQHSQVCRQWTSWLLHSQSTYFITPFLGCHKCCLCRRVCLCVYSGELVLHSSVVATWQPQWISMLFLQTATTIIILIIITSTYAEAPDPAPLGTPCSSTS